MWILRSITRLDLIDNLNKEVEEEKVIDYSKSFKSGKTEEQQDNNKLSDLKKEKPLDFDEVEKPKTVLEQENLFRNTGDEDDSMRKFTEGEEQEITIVMGKGLLNMDENISIGALSLDEDIVADKKIIESIDFSHIGPETLSITTEEINDIEYEDLYYYEDDISEEKRLWKEFS